MSQSPQPPIPETARYTHQVLREQLLDGGWERALNEEVARQVGSERAIKWGTQKPVLNPFKSICRELSTLYQSAPIWSAPDGEMDPTLLRILRRLWVASHPFQIRVIGLREGIRRIAATEDRRVVVTPVSPCSVVAQADPDDPGRPIRIEELRDRGDLGWCWDVYDISSPSAPFYRVISEHGDDITARVHGATYEGAAYPYRYADDRPYLPYVIYHAEAHGDRLWDWSASVEAVNGSLDLSVGHAFLWHCLKNASFPQRYMFGLEVEGAAEGRIRADPARVIQGSMREDWQGQPVVGQFGSAADLDKIDSVLDSLANRLALEAGVPPGDIQRLGGTARSGYAIALSNEGKRIAASKFAPSFALGDVELAGKIAALLNRLDGLRRPEDGYEIEYGAIALSPEERASRLDYIERARAEGLISEVEAYILLHPGCSPERAKRELGELKKAQTQTQTQTNTTTGA